MVKWLQVLFLCFLGYTGMAQTYKVPYEKDGFKGYVQFEIIKGQYLFTDGFSYNIRDNVINVVQSYENGSHDAVLQRAGIRFPITLNVSEANNTVDVVGNAYFYLSPQKATQHSSQPSVRLSLYDFFPGIPDFSESAIQYAKKYQEEQNINLWKTTGGLKNLKITFVNLLDLKAKVKEAIRNAEAEAAKKAEDQKREEEAQAQTRHAAGSRQNEEGKKVNTSSTSWESVRQESVSSPSSVSSSTTRRSTSPSSPSSSREQGGTHSSNASFEQAMERARREHEIRKWEQEQIEKSLAPLGETIEMVGQLTPKSSEAWADLYFGGDQGKGISAARLGLESRTYHGGEGFVLIGITVLKVEKLRYYYYDKEEGISQYLQSYDGYGGELQLGFGSRFFHEDPDDDAGSAGFWALVGYAGAMKGGKIKKSGSSSAAPEAFPIYGPRLILGYRMGHFSIRGSYSMVFSEKHRYLGLRNSPTADDKPRVGMLQIQIGYSW